jgi:hypothetical protein
MTLPWDIPTECEIEWLLDHGISEAGMLEPTPIRAANVCFPKEDAKDFLIDVLSEGAVAAKDVKRQAEEAGVSVASLRRAQRSLGVDVHREGGIAAKGRWLWSLAKVPKMSKVLTSEVEHLRHLSDGEAFEEPVSNASTHSYQEAQFGDGDPFASLKDPSLKLKAEPAREDYPELPEFLNRRAVS